MIKPSKNEMCIRDSTRTRHQEEIIFILKIVNCYHNCYILFCSNNSNVCLIFSSVGNVASCLLYTSDTVDIFPAIESFDGVAYRIEFWGDEIDRLSSFDPKTGQEIDEQDELNIYPTNLFVTTQERINMAIGQIDVDLGTQVNFLKEIGKHYEAKRLYERVTFDLEMIRCV